MLSYREKCYVLAHDIALARTIRLGSDTVIKHANAVEIPPRADLDANDVALLKRGIAELATTTATVRTYATSKVNCAVQQKRHR